MIEADNVVVECCSADTISVRAHKNALIAKSRAGKICVCDSFNCSVILNEADGISCEGKRAVQLKAEDYENYDLFICMDSANVRNATRILNCDKDSKVKKLLSFCGEERDVADPWYTDDFETTYNDVLRGCKALIEKLYQ